MKIVATFFLSICFIVSCATVKEKTYTGSTPAGNIIRLFLGIPLSDSVDFIRWKLILGDEQYHLQCNFGIGKPNTNGFISGGEKIEFNGPFKREKNYFQLQHDNKVLKIAELNGDLLHLLDTDNALLAGNGGWSYTLNNITPSITDQLNLTPRQTILKDSMTFEGRTPCNVPGVIPAGMQCYKLKWYLVLYANAEKSAPGQYKVFGTLWRKENGRTGDWKIINGKNGRIVYQLNDEKGNGFLYLLKPAEHILLFTDAAGKLLVGNEDFSYTLNHIEESKLKK